MIAVTDVAKWFRTKGELSHKKLQKLCYYAQAWYCALYDGSPLFGEKVEAWVHGPVIPELYRQYAGFGWTNIPKCEEKVEFSEKEIAILEAVYNTYWRFSGDQLELLTHREDPWKNARGELQPWEPSTVEIKTADMREYYAARYKATQND